MTAPTEGRVEPHRRQGLPSAWTFEARQIGDRFSFREHTRPWNWTELRQDEALIVWEICARFVAFFNARYVERTEQRIPPCWPEHGAIVEEVTTLAFAHWQAFESPHATIGGAHYWHQYSVPGFLERLPRWLGPDRLARCQQGLHEDTKDTEPANHQLWEERLAQIALAESNMRPAFAEDPTPEHAQGEVQSDGLVPPQDGEPDPDEKPQVPFLENRWNRGEPDDA